MTYTEIKARHEYGERHHDLMPGTEQTMHADRAWLIAECERLRAALSNAPGPPADMDEAAFRDYGFEVMQWFYGERARALK